MKFVPEHCKLRPIRVGVDLPGWFVSGLKSIDSNLFLIWHEHFVLTENFISGYLGSLDDPRFAINYNHGATNFGYVPPASFSDVPPKDAKKWHIWWLQPNLGWCHVMPIHYKGEAYLRTILDRLLVQAKALDTRKARNYVKELVAAEKAAHAKEEMRERERFDEVLKANDKMLNTVMDNFSRGKLEPAVPMKNHIISYPGQVNRGSVRVPVEEHEGGFFSEDV